MPWPVPCSSAVDVSRSVREFCKREHILTALFAELSAKCVDPEIATLEELPVTKIAPPLCDWWLDSKGNSRNHKTTDRICGVTCEVGIAHSENPVFITDGSAGLIVCSRLHSEPQLIASKRMYLLLLLLDCQ